MQNKLIFKELNNSTGFRAQSAFGYYLIRPNFQEFGRSGYVCCLVASHTTAVLSETAKSVEEAEEICGADFSEKVQRVFDELLEDEAVVSNDILVSAINRLQDYSEVLRVTYHPELAEVKNLIAEIKKSEGYRFQKE